MGILLEKREYLVIDEFGVPLNSEPIYTFAQALAWQSFYEMRSADELEYRIVSKWLGTCEGCLEENTVFLLKILMRLEPHEQESIPEPETITESEF